MPRAQRSNDSQPKPVDASSFSISPDSSHIADTDRIAARAYERYEARGRQDGRDLDDWLEAEEDLRRGPSGSTTS